MATPCARAATLRGTDFITFDLPGLLPIAQDNGGANLRGDIVGTYCDLSPGDLANTLTHWFLLRQDVLTTIDYTGAAKDRRRDKRPRCRYGSQRGYGFLLSRED
jgi:hypothetical protein